MEGMAFLIDRTIGQLEQALWRHRGSSMDDEITVSEAVVNKLAVS
jgi:hypothetical protein